MVDYRVSGSFEGRGDTDWYRVYLEGGHSYLLNSDTSFDTLRTASGDVIASGYGKVSIIESGWYFVEAGGYYSDITRYTLSIQSLPDDDIPASPLTPRTITLNELVTVDRDYTIVGDDDWFGFDAEAGKSYQFTAVRPDPQQLPLPVHVYDANGVEVSDSGHFNPAANGHYYVGVNHDGISSYAIRMRGIADDAGQTVATKATITIGVEKAASFEGPGDIDWFRVQLTAGHSYLLHGSGLVVVADASGAIVGQYAEGSSVFSAATGGTYYVVAKDFHSFDPSTYRLSIEELAGDRADNVTTTGKASVNGPIVGDVLDTYDDVDWWAVQAQAGVSYQIAGMGNVKFRTYDAASHQLTGEDTGLYTAADGSFTAAATGTYYVAVVNDHLSAQESYQFSVKSYADDYAATTTTTGDAVVGQALIGQLEVAGDTDWFAIELQAGVTYQAGDDYTYGRFRDASGAIVTASASVTASSGANIFTPTVSGTYYLEIFDGPSRYSTVVSVIPNDVPGNATTTAELRIVWNGTDANDNYAGTDLADELNGYGGNDRLYGLAGNDRLDGSNGNDLLTGGAGDDELYAGTGTDRLIGEDGDDTMYAYSGGDTVTMTGGAGDDTYWIGAGVHATVVEKAGGGIDTIATYAPSLTLRSEVENLQGWGNGQTLTGNTLANTITGYTGNDVIDGGTASDTLYGNAGSDRLIGGDGADTLFGGSGDDLIRGGTGSDVLSGGTGADRFLFIPGDLGASGDRIIDFKGAEGDRMDLAGYGAFNFIGTAAFSGVAGQLRYTAGTTATVVQADLNGDRIADIVIKLDGAMALGKANFVLAAGSVTIEQHALFAHSDASAHLLDPVHAALV